MNVLDVLRSLMNSGSVGDSGVWNETTLKVRFGTNAPMVTRTAF